MSLADIQAMKALKIANQLTSLTTRIPTTINLFDKTKVTTGGYYNYSNGLWTNDPTYFTTDYIPVLEGKTYTHKGNAYVNYYNSSKGWLNGNASSKPFTVPTGQGIAYARVTMSTADIDTEMVVMGAVFPTTYQPFADAISRKPITHNDTTFTSKVAGTINLFDKSKITSGGYFDFTNGVWISNSAYFTTDYIPVTEGSTYTHKTGNYFVNYYDNSYTWKSGANTSLPFTVPTGQGIVYARLAMDVSNLNTEMVVKGSVFPGTYYPYVEAVTYKNIVGLAGLKWNALGDSITYGLNANTPYASIIASRTGLIARNYGVSGSRITSAGDRTDSMVERYSAMDADADIITVFGGTNDWGNSMPLGVFGDTVTTTLYGALKVLIEGLITKYPTKRIGFILPMPRSGQTAPDSALKNYINIIKEMCDRYSIPTLDLYTGSGFAPDLTVSKNAIIPDGLHPNNAGHQLLANKIQAFLLRI